MSMPDQVSTGDPRAVSLDHSPFPPCTEVISRRWRFMLGVLVTALLLGDPIVSAQEVVAIAGEPYGVGYVRVQWPKAIGPNSSILVTSPDDRVFHPAAVPVSVTVREPMQLDPAPRDLRFGRGRILERLGQVVKAAVTADEHQEVLAHEIWFLFRGDAPFRLQINGPQLASIEIRPVDAVREDQQLALRTWWRHYEALADERIAAAEHLPVIDAYLLASLSQRLDLPTPASLARLRESKLPGPLGLMTDSSQLRRDAFADLLRKRVDDPVDARVELPPARDLPPIAPVDDEEGPAGIEPIARRVPPECFYLRFGSFNNFLWYQKLTQQYGGDIFNMINRPMLNQENGGRVEELLNVYYTQLADVFGDALIEDVAVVGTDLLIADGPSMGVLLKAKNAFLLGTTIRADRQSTADKFADCELRTETIDGIEVSILATPDHRIRSFLVVNGDYFFITSSRHLASRFIEARKSRQTLAALPEFQRFRGRYPTGDQRPITIFLSRRFLTGLYQPKFLVERLRRSQVAAEIAAYQAALVHASGEGRNLRLPEELIAEGFLPEGFGRRSDQSGLIITQDGVLDSRLGGRQTMLPIADAQVEAITLSEAAYLRHSEGTLSKAPGLVDPIFVQIERLTTPIDGDVSAGGTAANTGSPASGTLPIKGWQRLKIAANVPPSLLGSQAELVNDLGPPSDIGMRFSPSDLISFHANINSDRLRGSIPQHYLFGGVKDCRPAPLDKFESSLDRLFAVSTIRGYLAAWPDPGIIDRLPLGLGRGSPVGPNMTRLVGGAYRYQSDRVSLLSFDRDVLIQTIPDLAVLDKQPRTSARVVVKDLRNTQLGDWVDDALLREDRRKSLAGAEFLNRLSTQMNVDPVSAKAVAKDLLGAELQCAVGGEYACDPSGRWRSSKREGTQEASSALLQWFRGLDLNVSLVDDRLDCEIDLELE
ncbi:MAG: hypothetical protein R3C05_15595 [Pirellulaceae bacterium]